MATVNILPGGSAMVRGIVPAVTWNAHSALAPRARVRIPVTATYLLRQAEQNSPASASKRLVAPICTVHTFSTKGMIVPGIKINFLYRITKNKTFPYQARSYPWY